MRLALTYQRVDPTKGGAETYIVDLCARLMQAGHQVQLFANDWKANALPAGLITQRIPIHGINKWQRLWNFAQNSEKALIALANTYDCSIGFINTWHQDILIPQGGVHAANLAANSMRFPPGLRRHAYLLGKATNPKRWIYKAIETRQYDPKRGSRIIAVSKMVAGHLERYQNVASDRIDVIPNAIDATRLNVPDTKQTRDSFRKQFGLQSRDLVGLFVGHNYALKGLTQLLQGLARRNEQKPDARPIHLVICGGTDVAPYQALAERLNITPYVHMAGFQTDIRPPFWGSDFFVSPTFYDPCSLVVFEALACGLPVITTTCNGAGEVMTQGRQGFVISHPNAVDELAKAIDQMTDDDARLAMSAKATQLGLDQSFDHHVERLVAVAERVAAIKSRREVTVTNEPQRVRRPGRNLSLRTEAHL
jgi:UDP-glucose:(heptosyl)LPS alpha-1,3-glucosyltransferase